MKRRQYIIAGGVSVSAAASGCLRSPKREYRDEAWVNVHVIPDNILLGVDSEQYLDIRMSPRNIMARRLPEESQEHHINIDLSSVEQYGVNIDNLSVETTQPKRASSDVANRNVDAVEFTDGVITLVIVTSDDIAETDPIALEVTGFEFTDVDAVTEIRYDIQSPNDHVDVSDFTVSGYDGNCKFSGSGNGGFMLIDPRLLPPAVCPSNIGVTSMSQSQRLVIEWLTPEDDELLIEIDMSALDDYGTISGNVVKREIRGAVLEDVTIDDWTVSMRLVPDSDSNYVMIDIRVRGIGLTVVDPVEDVSYEVTVEGDAHETVETESFSIEEMGEPV